MSFSIFKKTAAQFLRLCFFACVLTSTTAFADVAVLGSWVTGLSHAKEPGSPGLRALVVFVYGENTAAFSATGVTYGGIAMSKIVDKAFTNASGTSYTSAWILNEGNIVSADSAGAIVVTWSATPSAGTTVESVFLTGVDPTTPQGVFASNGVAIAAATTAALATVRGDMVFIAGTADNDGTYALNNGFTKAYDASGLSWGDAVAGWKSATGVNETPSLTLASPMRQTLIGFVTKSYTKKSWDGGGADDNWTTPLNWNPDLAPEATNVLEFAGITRLTPVNNFPALTKFNEITFANGAGAFTLSGNSITLSGNIVNYSSNLQTINLNINTIAGRSVHTPGGSITLGGVISGAGGLMKDWGENTLTLSATNTYTGYTHILYGIVSIKTIQNVSGGPSNLGAPVTAANGTIKMGSGIYTGTLLYTGAGNTTDRVIDLNGTTGGATIDQSGTGLLKFTSAFTATSGSGATAARSKTLRLQGSAAGTGEIAGAIVNPAGAYTTSLTKAGSGLWTLSGTSTYTGATTISAGTLNVTGSIAAGSAVTVASGATLSGTGTVAGTVAVSSGAIVAPGSGAVGTLNSGSLTLGGASVLNFELAAPGTCDKIAVTGNLILDGTLNVTALTGFAAGNYPLLTFTGASTDSGLTVGAMPSGFTGTISIDAGTKTVILTVSSGSGLPTILTPPSNLRIYTGDSAIFTVLATGTGLSYQWQRSADNGGTWTDATAGSGITSSRYSFQTQATDANAVFHCVVSNSFGPVTSGSARLKLCARITAPADQLNKKSGDVVTFAVTPSVDVISYSWWRSPDGNAWTQIANATGSTYNMTVGLTDTLVKFQCRMTDSCNNQTSATATLTACATPVVTDPASISAIETQVVRFKITATGAGRSYQWQRKPLGGSWANITDAIADSVAIAATTADSGAQFHCVVSNTCGTATSNAATLTVFTKARANFSMTIGGIPDSVGFAQDTARFADLSTGNDSMWIWSYGDGGKRDTSRTRGETKTHAYANPGQYAVVLYVQGQGGRDSMSRTLSIYSRGGNPIKITGQRLANDTVRLVFSNFGNLKAPGETPPPTVTTIKLWYQAGAIPLDSTSGATALAPYSLATLRTGGASYSATVRVPPLTSPNTKYGFMTQIVWSNNGGITPFDTLNGCLVLMSDTVRPVNRLVVSGLYVPSDTVTFFIDSVQTIGASSDSVGLWYGMGGDSVPDFARSNQNVRWWSVADIRTMAPGNRFTFVKQDTRFNTEQSTLRVAVVIKSVSKLLSNRVNGTFSVGRVRPSNPISLRATVLPNVSGSVVLTWSYANTDIFERIRIYYRTGSAIPVNQYDFSGLRDLDSIVLPPSAPMFDTVKNLTGATRYYFGAQIFRQGMWSNVTIGSSATDSTPEAASATVRNTITVTRAVFDADRNRFRISWKIDTTRTSLTANPVPASLLRIGFSLSSINLPQWERIGQNQRPVTSDTGTVILDAGDSLIFDHDFYVFLWLQKSSQQWVNPTDSSTRIVHTTPFVWQEVHYNFTTAGDTSLWANGQIRFTTAPVSPNFRRNWKDTIKAFTDPAGSAGFVSVGTSFLFALKQQPAERFDIGLKTQLPAGRKWQEVFVYRFDSTVGKWMVDRATQRRDTVNGYVYVNTNQLTMPFGVFIDTQPPVVRVTNLSSVPVPKASIVRYTVELSDNVGNLRWKFESAKGGEPFGRGTPVDSILTNGIDTARLAIPGNLVSDDNGVIARFLYDDGAYGDTIDLSRQVIRDSGNSDLQWTSELKWVPLRVTAKLDMPRANRLLRFIDTVASNPQYDNRYVRLVRWYPGGSNTTGKDRWVEYSKAPDSVFDFKSGRLMWMKTREKRLLQFGRAVTMSQKVPDTVPLFANDWTDFSLPFRYNMRIGDIIAATRSAGYTYADSFQIYNWVKGPTGTYGPELFFAPLPGKDSLTGLMKYTGDNIGFTVYNPSNSVGKLIIPPISESMSALSGALPKRAASGGSGRWAARILPRTADGATLTSVYCGYTARRSESGIFYPVAPSFDGIGVSVIDEKSGRVSGHKMSGDLAGGGCSYLLMFSNGSPSAQTIRCTLERTGEFPSAMKTVVYNSQTGETVDIGKEGLSVPVEGEGREYRWLFTGDAQYVASAGRVHAGGKLALTSVYPNPVRRFTHVLYTLPLGRVSRVDFTVLDIMGRTVWHESVRETAVSGGHRDYVWYGNKANGRRVAAGMYVLKMVAADSKGREVGAFERRLTVLP